VFPHTLLSILLTVRMPLVLMPYSTENGGPLKIERINYVPKRNNIIITYPGTTDKYVSFVGSHMDVVTANPSEWTRDPFKLTREGDNLYGRGTTDCLGHVVLLTDLFIQVRRRSPRSPNAHSSLTTFFVCSCRRSSPRRSPSLLSMLPLFSLPMRRTLRSRVSESMLLSRTARWRP
jgi:hypothetical protein